MIASIVISENPVKTAGAGVERTLIRSQFSDYQHEIRAMGGFWECSFSTVGRLDPMMDLLERALGAHVESYTEAGDEAWEGIITKMVLDRGDLQISLTLDEVANKVWTRYNTSTSGTDVGGTLQQFDSERLARQAGGSTTFLRSVYFNNPESQLKYGTREMALDGGISTAAIAEQKASMYGEAFSWPMPQVKITGKPKKKMAKLSFKCEGYFRTIGWKKYNTPILSGTENASDQVARIASLASYIGSARAVIETNISQVEAKQDADRSAMDVLMDAARVGDSSFNRWVVGVYEGRIMEYGQAVAPDPDNLQYFISNDKRGALEVRNRGQGVMPLALVRPSVWANIPDIFIYKPKQLPDLREDPSSIFLEAVTYKDPGQLDIAGSRNRLLDVQLARAGMGSVSLV